MTARDRAAIDHIAHGLADALLAGDWTRPAMLNRARAALDRRAAPAWLGQLVDEVLAAYHRAPVDRPRELAGFVRYTPALAKGLDSRRPPRIVRWTPTPTALVRTWWPVTPLPELGALARLLDLDQGELAWFADVRHLERSVAEPLRHYRWTDVHGRLVAAPKPRLKEIQRRLLRHVLRPIPVHASAHGAVAGRSVRTALDPHAGARVVVRADLERFFPSVRAGRVWALLRTAGLPEAVAHTATGLMTTVVPYDVSRDPWLAVPHLPTGAPTSPAVGNLVAYGLDRRLAGLAARFDAAYTRYVDDLVFSGDRLGPRLLDRVADIVRDEGFRLHDAKSVTLPSSRRQSLLGAVVNDHPTLSRPERDALGALLHNCARHGWRTQTRGFTGDFRAHVLGQVSWAGALDPALGARLRAAFDAIDWT